MKKEKFDYSIDCQRAAEKAQFAAREEIRVFSEILDMPIIDAWLVGDLSTKRNGNPHGMACVGDYTFGMDDIHVVIANYPALLEKYETNGKIAEMVITWHDQRMINLTHMNLHYYLLGVPEPTEEEKAAARERVIRMKRKLADEAYNFGLTKNGGF